MDGSELCNGPTLNVCTGSREDVARCVTKASVVKLTASAAGKLLSHSCQCIWTIQQGAKLAMMIIW